MPQFTPEPRDAVKDHLDDSKNVARAGPVSNGLRVEISDQHSDVTNLNKICVDTGWYVDNVDWERRCLYMFPMGENDD